MAIEDFNPVQRGLVLMEHRRFDLAEVQFRAAVTQNPDDAFAHVFLALVLLEQGMPEKRAEALREAQFAVHLAPDFAQAHRVLARVLARCNNLRGAEASAREAVRLEPDAAEGYTLLAAIHVDRYEWAKAAEAADQALAIDPTHIGATNLRAYALRQMNRRDEADAALETAIRLDPDNATTHTNLGWNLLSKGDHQGAVGHFREALRLEPSSRGAQEGIVEALKARNPIYRVVLGYFFWMARLHPRVRWGVVVGLYLLNRVVSELRRSHPDWAPFLLPITLLYMLFAFLSWAATPIFNLLLRLDPLGRMALTPEQRRATDWVGGALGAAALALIYGVATKSGAGILLALFFVGLLIPLSALFMRIDPKMKLAVKGYVGVMAAAGIVAAFAPEAIGSPAATLYVIMLVAYCWGGNLVLTVRPRR